MDQRAEERVGEQLEVLVESLQDGEVVGRARHQGPEVDGVTTLVGGVEQLQPGDLVRAEAVLSVGVDLVARVPAATSGAR